MDKCIEVTQLRNTISEPENHSAKSPRMSDKIIDHKQQRINYKALNCSPFFGGGGFRAWVPGNP